MAGDKSHRKKKSGRKAEKRKAAEGKKKSGDGPGGTVSGAPSARAALSDAQASLGRALRGPGD
jgi:hypothetical protein